MDLSKDLLPEQQTFTHVSHLYEYKFPTVYAGYVFGIDDFMIHQKENEHPVNYLQIKNLIDSKSTQKIKDLLKSSKNIFTTADLMPAPDKLENVVQNKGRKITKNIGWNRYRTG